MRRPDANDRALEQKSDSDRAHNFYTAPSEQHHRSKELQRRSSNQEGLVLIRTMKRFSQNSRIPSLSNERLDTGVIDAGDILVCQGSTSAQYTSLSTLYANTATSITRE